MDLLGAVGRHRAVGREHRHRRLQRLDVQRIVFAAKLVTWLPPGAVRWLVMAVVVYTAINMLATADRAQDGEEQDARKRGGSMANVNA